VVAIRLQLRNYVVETVYTVDGFTRKSGTTYPLFQAIDPIYMLPNGSQSEYLDGTLLLATPNRVYNMIDMPSKKRKPVSLRHTDASFLARNLRPIWPAVRNVVKFILLILKLLARPIVVFKSFSSEVKAAIIAGVFLLLYGILSQAGIITDIADLIRTRHETAELKIKKSGYATSSTTSLIALKNYQQIIGDNVHDQEVRLFLTYYVGDIPSASKVTRARLSFQCTLEGDVGSFGDLTLRQVSYDTYSPGIFDSFYPNPFSYATLFFPDNAVLHSGCASGTRCRLL
jgi:hypothetical protein